jgi:hypothetical protein
MSTNRIKLFVGVSLVLNLVGAVIIFALKSPTGPSDPDIPLSDCIGWFTVAQLLVLGLYNACYLYCIRGVDEDEARALCINNCLRWWIFIQISLVIGLLLCIANAVWF